MYQTGNYPVERRRQVIQIKETPCKGLEAEQPGIKGRLQAILRGSGWSELKEPDEPPGQRPSLAGPLGSVGADTDHGGEGQGKSAGQRGRII